MPGRDLVRWEPLCRERPRRRMILPRVLRRVTFVVLTIAYYGDMTMKRQIRLIAFPCILVAFGILLGMPAGFYFANQNADATLQTSANTNSIQLTLPKTFFSDLPKSGDDDRRLVSVDAINNLVLPRIGQQPKTVGADQLPPMQN